MRLTSRSAGLSVLAIALAACNPTTTPMDDAAVLPDSGPPDGGSPLTCAPVDPPCQDEQISALTLYTTVSTRTVEEETSTIAGAHQSHIDSMGGGLDPTESFVYARFTDAGLVRVDVSDEEAFASTDWDIAFRRFIVRLNSGVSGPSCVQGARLPNTGTGEPPTFESVTTLPATLSYSSEIYMTGSTCDVVRDGGIGAPVTVLSSFWSYDSCVAMTHNVYAIALANGRHVKLEVLGYYNPADQTVCDDTGAMPTTAGSSGNIRVQWAFVD
jgi:hypothetical protein